jgi:histone H3/H4
MLGPLDFERRRISLASGRDSDIRPEAIEDDTENTFVLTFPQQAGALEYGSGGSVTSPSARSVEDEDLDEIVPIHIEDLGPSYSQDDDELYASNQEPTTRDVNTPGTTKLKTNRNKKSKLSKHRIPYPSLPAGVVKKLAVQYARTGGNSKAAISKDTLAAISQASDWFLEQVSDDLGAYSEHAGRKTIDETDMITLMKRYVNM